MGVKAKRTMTWKVVPGRTINPIHSGKERITLLFCELALGIFVISMIYALLFPAQPPEPPPTYPITVISHGEDIRNGAVWTCKAVIKDAAGREYIWAGLQYCSLQQGDVIK